MVLVIGAGGFVGTALIEALILNNHVIATTRFLSVSHSNMITDEGKGSLRWIELRDSSPINCLDDIGSIDVVIWLASATPFTCSDADIYESNVKFGERVIEILKRINFGRLIYFSSVSVFDGSRNEVITDNTEVSSRSKYGQSKIKLEESVRKLSDFKQTTPHLIIRTCAIVGAGCPDTFVPRVVKSVLGSNPVEIYSRSGLFNGIIDVADVVRFVRDIIDFSGDVFARYPDSIICASSDPVSLQDLSAIVIDELEAECCPVFENFRGRPPVVFQSENASQWGWVSRDVASVLRDFCSARLRESI